MQILILHWKDIRNPHAGGGTRYAHHIAQSLSENHNVTLLSFRFDGAPKKTKINGNYTILRMGNKVTYHLKAPIYILKHRQEFDLILDSVILTPKLPIVSFFCEGRKVALIHQFFCDVIKEEFPSFFAPLIGFLEKLWPFFYRNFFIITVSDSTREKLLKRGIPKGIKIIPPGLKVGDYEYHPEQKADSPLLIYIGRLKKYKGLQHGVKAMEEVVKEFPNAKLLIAGRGDYKKKLEKIVENSSVSDNIELLGYVSEEKKTEMLKTAHLFIFPSIAEGWGISAIEAQTCGVPVIGTDTDGLRDSVKNGKTGRLVPYGEPDILAKEIIDLLSNPKKRRKLAEAAHQWAQNFNWKRTLNEMQKNLVSEDERMKEDRERKRRN